MPRETPSCQGKLASDVSESTGHWRVISAYGAPKRSLMDRVEAPEPRSFAAGHLSWAYPGLFQACSAGCWGIYWSTMSYRYSLRPRTTSHRLPRHAPRATHSCLLSAQSVLRRECEQLVLSPLIDLPGVNNCLPLESRFIRCDASNSYRAECCSQICMPRTDDYSYTECGCCRALYLPTYECSHCTSPSGPVRSKTSPVANMPIASSGWL